MTQRLPILRVMANNGDNYYISKNIPFVRVDWYLTNEKIYFGEMTFTTCGGMDNDLLEGDRIMGELLNVAQ